MSREIEGGVEQFIKAMKLQKLCKEINCNFSNIGKKKSIY